LLESAVNGGENLRKCLLDENGNRLRDKEGNFKTLCHKFAVYCDDIAAGANSLEELYELFEAFLCCCAKAGIQVKAAKVKFVWCHGDYISQLYHLSIWNETQGSKFVSYSQYGVAKRHTSSESFPWLLSANGRICQGVCDFRSTTS
jgi:hypothetical protein